VLPVDISLAHLNLIVLGVELDTASIVVVGLVGFLTLCFLLLYVLPAIWIWARVGRMGGKLRRLEKRFAKGQLIPRAEVDAAIPKAGTLRRAWAEYQETLHDQCDIVDGAGQVIRIRSTMPAAMYFSNQALVDTPVHTEFFKHLPGILTGIGIIGTFWHIIVGLQSFVPSMDPEVLNQGLTTLISSVHKAFIASVCAIFAAMVITVLEKLLLNMCYARVERVAQTLDGLYEAGAGEEYLARLVDSAEESATQTRHLKDSLVDDLKHLLTGLAERQMAAATVERQALVSDLGRAITNVLSEPMSKIAAVVEQASGDQGKAVQGMVGDLLTAFMGKLDETVGGQMKTLMTVMNQNVLVMQEMQEGVRGMIGELGRTNADHTRDLLERIGQMMASTEERQRTINETVLSAVGQMREQMAGAQATSSARLEESVQSIGAGMRGLMDGLAEQRELSTRSTVEEMDKLSSAVASLMERMAADRTAKQQADDTRAAHAAEVQDQLIARMSDRVEVLVDGVGKAVEGLRETIRSLDSVTTRAADGMGRGADAMRQAAEGFGGTAGELTSALAQGKELFHQVVAASRTLEAATVSVRDAAESYEETRRGVEAMAESLRTVAADVETRATLNRSLTDDMGRLVRQFEAVQRESGEYLQRVSAVLEEGFQGFADAVAINMDRSRGHFDKSLSEGVGMIASQLGLLEEVLDGFNTRGRVNA
jgi:chemotaxis protein CheY-P-specific phosphatase CheC